MFAKKNPSSCIGQERVFNFTETLPDSFNRGYKISERAVLTRTTGRRTLYHLCYSISLMGRYQKLAENCIYHLLHLIWVKGRLTPVPHPCPSRSLHTPEKKGWWETGTIRVAAQCLCLESENSYIPAGIRATLDNVASRPWICSIKSHLPF